ncbi:MAG: alpha/beta hydrolase [Alphaproteobacteria bacterium]|nr:alpha/beta hydrolase [Alphaproteobacteria bacterium]MBV9551443.1 alpha/beta hydrolase [Alphaproteobacteria bacterium]
MPSFRPSADLDMHYEVDDFTDPWRHPETVLLLHGNAESGLAWWRWVPKLARNYRVVRPDMRGFGKSSPMPRDFHWTLDRLIEDFCLLMDHLGIARFHLVGAKIGGTVARAFAARRSERVTTLTVVGSPPPFREEAAKTVGATIKLFEDYGVEHWARQNMSNRLGSAFPQEGFDFWVKYMARTALSTQLGFMPTIAIADIRADIPKIKCPTLVITTEESGLGSVDAMREWQVQIAGSELVVFPGNSYHVAATHADQSADATLDFLQRRG